MLSGSYHNQEEIYVLSKDKAKIAKTKTYIKSNEMLFVENYAVNIRVHMGVSQVFSGFVLTERLEEICYDNTKDNARAWFLLHVFTCLQIWVTALTNNKKVITMKESTTGVTTADKIIVSEDSDATSSDTRLRKILDWNEETRIIIAAAKCEYFKGIISKRVHMKNITAG